MKAIYFSAKQSSGPLVPASPSGHKNFWNHFFDVTPRSTMVVDGQGWIVHGAWGRMGRRMGPYGWRMGPNGKAGGQGMPRLRGLMGTGDLAAWRHGATAGQEKWKEERRVRERQRMKDMKVLHLAARRHGAAARAGWVEKEVGEGRDRERRRRSEKQGQAL